MEYFRYHSTNCFFLKSSRNDDLLAIDAGWPCTLYEYKKLLKTIGHAFSQIKWAFVTHFHMDHAGLTGEFIDSGIQCFVFENQIAAIDEMEKLIKKNYKEYKTILKERLRIIETRDSREFLREIGIYGEVIVTDGHSPDSISFITDAHEAIIGDLSPLDQIMPEDKKNRSSWDKLKSLGARTIYPSHAEIFNI